MCSSFADRSGLRAGALVSLLYSVCLLSGCTQSFIRLPSDFSQQAKDETVPITDVMCLWQAAEGRDMDGIPARGFAGQLFFFERGNALPTIARGDIRIYVFDDQGPIEQQATPIHQYDFEDEAWQTHLYDATFGPTYQIFIPYPRKGHHSATCTLLVRFSPVGKRPIFSDPATIMLKGTPTERVHIDQSREWNDLRSIVNSMSSSAREKDSAAPVAASRHEHKVDAGARFQLRPHGDEAPAAADNLTP